MKVLQTVEAEVTVINMNPEKRRIIMNCFRGKEKHRLSRIVGLEFNHENFQLSWHHSYGSVKGANIDDIRKILVEQCGMIPKDDITIEDSRTIKGGTGDPTRTRNVTKNFKRYLGDGVYVLHDGFGVVLTTENGISTTNTIYLEPPVYQALEDWYKDLKEYYETK